MSSRGKRFTFSAKLPIKKVAPGAIAPPDELIADDLTKVVPLMFDRRGKPDSKKAKVVTTTATTATTVTKPIQATQKDVLAALPPPVVLSLPVRQQEQPAQEQPEPAQEQPEPAQEPAQKPVQEPAQQQTLKLRRPKKRYSTYLTSVKTAIQQTEGADPYIEAPTAFVPQSRKGFASFIMKTYGDFALPPRIGAPDLEACKKLGAAGEDTTKMYLYQQFVREYIREQSPYRGALVYHGLGSGKTCSAIAAMEALYGTFNKKIIVMTPFSLQNNFISEITFCGFRHFRLQNHWVAVSLVEDPTAKLFAKEVLGLPEPYFTKKIQSIYVPDFSKPSNYDSLPDAAKAQIREQIFAIIRNRIEFISYNGIRASQLKIWACSEPDHFDNAVIIIDEVHNLTRLMQGTIEPYLMETPGKKRRIVAEPITPGRWKPSLCNVSANYKRAFLFYKLLCGAKRSKIIGLSGTPLVNFPEELGILANILNGYNDCVEVPVTSSSLTADQIEQLFKTAAKQHPRVDFYSFTRTQSSQVLFFSKVREGYVKVFDASGNLQGFQFVDEEATPESIQEIYAAMEADLSAKGIEFGTPTFKSEAILNPDSESFTKNFIDVNSLKVRNEIVLSKRLSGLISYYRGSKEEFMPRVVRDDLVKVPFSEYSLVGYLGARKHEQAGEKAEKDPGSKKLQSAWQEVLGIAKMANPSSYRFRSRAACNFVFPESIQRPFPNQEVDMELEIGREVDVLGDQEGDAVEDDKASIAAEAEDAAIDTDVAVAVANQKPVESLTYQEQIRSVLSKLRAAKDSFFKLKSDTENTLVKFSPKYAEILTKIESIDGSALVYSQFRTLEGIGVFGIALEANGYIPIEILGSDADPYFSPTTEASFRAHFMATTEKDEDEGNNTSTVLSSDSEETETSDTESTSPTPAPTGGALPKKRYILYSGEESRERRNLMINLFNARFDRLPPKIAKVLRESGFEGPTNKKGDICKVISITGAGAEGLSLKNVRSVHIMEPFWNPVRTDQVKGRAVRICSHAELPVNERTVEVYTYVATVSEEAIARKLVDESFLILDNGVTSDQMIQAISDKKKKVNDDLLRVMKASAVDCNLNSTENNTSGETVRCFVIKGSNDDFMYDPRIDNDIIETERAQTFVEPQPQPQQQQQQQQQQQPQTTKYTLVGIKGKQYIADPQADGSFALYNVRDRLFERRLGTRILNTATGKYKSVFTTAAQP